MLITCPYCKTRSSHEFSYLGDAALLSRPEHDAPERVWTDYVYLRHNPRGTHEELWYHGAGCGAWLKVTRDTASHEILNVELVRP